MQRVQIAATRFSLDPTLIEAIIQVESDFNPSAVSVKNATGLMQVIPKTAREVEIESNKQLTNHLMGGCAYFRKLLNRYQGKLSFALAAYNAGPSQVDRFKGIPPFQETQNYVNRVLNLYKKLKKTR